MAEKVLLRRLLFEVRTLSTENESGPGAPTRFAHWPRGRSSGAAKPPHERPGEVSLRRNLASPIEICQRSCAVVAGIPFASHPPTRGMGTAGRCKLTAMRVRVVASLVFAAALGFAG